MDVYYVKKKIWISNECILRRFLLITIKLIIAFPMFYVRKH